MTTLNTSVMRRGVRRRTGNIPRETLYSLLFFCFAFCFACFAIFFGSSIIPWLHTDELTIPFLCSLYDDCIVC
jgi:hypothetical protein